MCFVFIWEQTATCATYSINWLVFITEIKSVYSAVRTGSLNKAVCSSSLKVNHVKGIHLLGSLQIYGSMQLTKDQRYTLAAGQSQSVIKTQNGYYHNHTCYNILFPHAHVS